MASPVRQVHEALRVQSDRLDRVDLPALLVRLAPRALRA
jgi:hypothetical protein